MAQHDYTLANQDGASFRSDLNQALAAIVSGNSGASAPSSPYAFQWWVETPASGRKLVWQRNAANSAWTGFGEVGGAVFSPDFFVCAQDTPDMTVHVQAGKLRTAARTVKTQAAQNTTTITAPASNPRYDLIVIDALSGAAGVVTGTEAASPEDPEIPDGKIAIARIALTTSTTSITDADITDLRGLQQLGYGQTDPRQVVDIFDDFAAVNIDSANGFISSVLGWCARASGSGAALAISDPGFDISANPGVVTLRTGTTNSGDAAIMGGESGGGSSLRGTVTPGGGRLELEALCRIEDLPTAGQDFEVRFGLRDTNMKTVPTNAIEIICPANSSGVTSWRVRTRSASTGSDTTASNPVTVAADVWVRLRIVVNAAATAVRFYVGDTLIHTATTNIPSGNGKLMAPYFAIEKFAGTTERKVYLDYFRMKYELTTRR